MKKISHILLFIVLLFLAGCTVQEEVKPKQQEQKPIVENKVIEEPPKVNKPTEPVTPKKGEVQHQPKFERIEVTLNRPIDGDTIQVLYNGNAESVRFLLIDTPETSHPRLGKQPFGEEAKAFTNKMVQNANKIELEFDIGPLRDKYSRLLAYVYIDGKMLQEELLKRGLARVAYVYPPSTRYVDQFRALQEKSQMQGIGIWSVENYAKQDGYHPEVMEEKKTKEQNTTSNKCTIKGNINSSGEKIYHVPSGAYYKVTKPEKCFDTEKEAELAGFRKSKR